MSNPQAWDEATKIEALTIWRTDGASQASRVTGVPSGTIRRWVHESGLGGPRRDELAARQHADAEARVQAEEEHQRRLREWLTASEERQAIRIAELKEMLLDTAAEALHRIDDEHIDFKGKEATMVVYPKPDPAGVRAYVTAAAIAIDKWRLVTGQATSRVETVGESPIDRELARLVDEIERRAQAEAQSGTVATPPQD